MTKLNDQIAQYRRELEDHRPWNTRRAQGFYNLAKPLMKRFEETDDVTNLDEAIPLHRSAFVSSWSSHRH